MTERPYPEKYLEMIQIHKQNRLAGLHPLCKLWIILLYSVCSFVLGSLGVTRYRLALWLIPWFGAAALLGICSGELRRQVRAFRGVIYVAAFIFVVQTFLVPGGDVIWRFGILRICEKGFQTAVSLSFMIMNIAGIFVWFFQTTSNKEITRALSETKLDYRVAYTFASTLQMIDTMSGESKKIMAAQRARGVETEGNLIVRARAFFPALVPLMLSGIIGAEEKVLTLESRGFSVQGNRTYLFHLEKSGWERPALAVSAAITVLITAGRIVLLWM